ncbi:MAG: nucleotide exchange factor GrpE [bacterium]
MKTKDRADSKEQTIEISDENQMDCQKQIEKLHAENAELKDQLIRKAAELENFRKRTNREKQELLEYGNEKLQVRFLEIADDFENAFDAAEKSNADAKMLEGFQMIFRKLQKIFADHNIVEIEDPCGKQFDVNYHEAIMAMPSEIEEGAVVQQVQKGYRCGDKILRHTKVITSKGNE